MKSALFDLDGTLIDSRADIVLAVNLARQDFGLAPRPASEIEACVGEGVPALIRRAIPERPDLWPELLACQRAHYRKHALDRTALYPGVLEALKGLSAKGWKMAVVTNKPSDVTTPILDGLGILRFFGAVVGGGDCESLKPDPAPLFLAASRLGVSLTPEDWMVGDHFADLEAGTRAGVRRCFCRYGFGDARGLSYELAVSRLDEFVELCECPVA
jgi:phosphoglycolate phosphatase